MSAGSAKDATIATAEAATIATAEATTIATAEAATIATAEATTIITGTVVATTIIIRTVIAAVARSRRVSTRICPVSINVTTSTIPIPSSSRISRRISRRIIATGPSIIPSSRKVRREGDAGFRKQGFCRGDGAAYLQGVAGAVL